MDSMCCLTTNKREWLQKSIARIKAHREVISCERHGCFVKSFENARNRIRTRVLDEFRKHEWPRFQMLDEIFTQKSGLPVPTLSVCGEGTAEIRFTKLLAYFFDSRNQHGLCGLLARAVFADKIESGDQFPFDRCIAKAEDPLGESRQSDGQQIQNSLDILIEVGKHRILIEQKINSAEGNEQLSRYSDGMRKKYGSSPMHCFFLTPDGREGQVKEWAPLSYNDLLTRMASVLDRHALSVTARHNLRALLWDLLLGPLAQNIEWLNELRKYTAMVAKDYTKYIDLKRWFSRYGLSCDSLRIVAKLIGD